MMNWIKLESDGSLNGAAGLWDQFTNKLTTIRDHIVSAADQLAAGGNGTTGWPPSKSVAAASFLTEVGKSTYSLDEWITFSSQNARSRRDAAKQVAASRIEMKKIYATYVQEHNAAMTALNKDNAAVHSDRDQNQGGWSKFWNGSYAAQDGEKVKGDKSDLDAARKKATKAGQGEMKKLAGVYIDSWAGINEGSKYKGPLKGTDPMQLLMKKLTSALANGSGGGGGNLTAQQTAMRQQQLLMQQQLQHNQQLIRERQQLLNQQRAAAQRRLQRAQARAAADLARQQAALRARQEALAKQQAALRQEQAALRQQLAAQQPGSPPSSSRCNARWVTWPTAPAPASAPPAPYRGSAYLPDHHRAGRHRHQRQPEPEQESVLRRAGWWRGWCRTAPVQPRCAGWAGRHGWRRGNAAADDGSPAGQFRAAWPARGPER